MHKKKTWTEIPCIKRLLQRRDEMKEELDDLTKHLKVIFEKMCNDEFEVMGLRKEDECMEIESTNFGHRSLCP